MWRWTAIIMAMFLYVVISFALNNYITGTGTAEVLIRQFVPLTAAIIIPAVIVFAVH